MINEMSIRTVVYRIRKLRYDAKYLLFIKIAREVKFININNFIFNYKIRYS